MPDFSEEDIQKVWNKGATVSGYDSEKFRKDKCDAWMTRSQYGNRDSIYGWEIHHVDPDGGDKIENLLPCNGKTIASDNKKLSCPVVSNGNKNVKA